MIVSEYYSEDRSRKGIVYKEQEGHRVDLFQDKTLVKTVMLPDKSIHYAEDTAENWVMRILE